MEPDWDSFVVPMVISELDWDSYVLPVVISELDSDWDLFGLLVYRRIVSQRSIICTLVPTDPCAHGMSEFLFFVASRDLEVEAFPSWLDSIDHDPSISFRNWHAMNCPTLDRHFMPCATSLIFFLY